jgi:hypothetical protein
MYDCNNCMKFFAQCPCCSLSLFSECEECEKMESDEDEEEGDDQDWIYPRFLRAIFMLNWPRERK